MSRQPELAQQLGENQLRLSSDVQPPSHLAASSASDVPTAQTLQIAVDAINERYESPNIWKNPSIGTVLMNVASELSAVTRNVKMQGTAGPAGNRVLLVDDVEDVLVAVGAFLIKEGFPVCKASNGDEALRLIGSDPSIGLLVADFAMPGLNGVDLIAQATQLRPNLRAVIITGYPHADGLKDLPADTAVIVKPFRRSVLVAAVRAMLAKGTNAADAVSDGPAPSQMPLPEAQVIDAGEELQTSDLMTVAAAARHSQKTSPLDCMAEGLWRLACGESCQETWEMLSESRKTWWRDSADRMFTSWCTRQIICY